MLKRKVALIIVFSMILFMFGSIMPIHAQVQVNFTSVVNKAQVAPMGEFYATHTISNLTGGDIVVRVTEWLEDSPGRFISEETVKAGQELMIEGRTFNAVNGLGRHVLNYRAEYRSIDTYEAWVELVSDFLLIETVIDTGISVKYNAQHGETVFKGQSVEFVAEVRSLGNVPIMNIIVEDSILGVIGEIPLLEVGETETITKSFALNETSQGHIVLRFQEPYTQSEIIRPLYDSTVRVEVSEQMPAFSLELSAEADKSYIPQPVEITFDFRIRNTGEIAIQDIEVSNWDGEIFHVIDSLMPGHEALFRFSAMIEPEKPYEFRARGQVQGMREPVETTHTVTISQLKPLVEIEREVINDPQPVLRYTIRNVGNVALIDIEIEELEVGVIARLERMEPGDTEQITDNLDLSRDRISNPILIAKEAANMTIYRYQAGEMLIPANMTATIPHVTVSVNVEPNHLSAPGIVDLECIVKNEGNVVLRNVEIVLKERDLTIGSLAEFNTGEQHVFELSDLRTELSQSFTVVVRAEDTEGNEFLFESDPIEITVEQRSPSLGFAQAAEEARGSFLRTIFGIIIILGILTAGALIYFMKSSFLPIRRKRRQTG